MEAAGVFNVLGVDEATRRESHATLAATRKDRPAEGVVCRAREIHSGAVGSDNGRVALDVSNVCPQASSHNSYKMCTQYGRAEMVVQTLIFESLGGDIGGNRTNTKSFTKSLQ